MVSCSGWQRPDYDELIWCITGLLRITEQDDTTNWLIDELTDRRSVKRETDRWFRDVVIFPGEGAVKSFVECLAVLFVSFDSSQDHLRARGDSEGQGEAKKWGKTKRKDGLLIRHVGFKCIYSFFICHEMKGRVYSLNSELQHDGTVLCVMYPAESVIQFKRSKVQRMERSRKPPFLWLIGEQRHCLWRAVWTDHTPHRWQQQWQHSLKDPSGSLYMTMFLPLF